jgi:hypothetical protein
MRVARTLVVSLALVGAAPSAVLALPPSPPSASKSRSALAELTVHGHISTSSYKRSKFGTGWISQGNGCTTRDRVLLRDGLDPTAGSGCAVTATHRRSVYDGLISTVRGRVDIDHIVPLANAWVSGASKWSRARRVAFANDLAERRAGDAAELLTPGQRVAPLQQAMADVVDIECRHGGDAGSSPRGESQALPSARRGSRAARSAPGSPPSAAAFCAR